MVGGVESAREPDALVRTDRAGERQFSACDGKQLPARVAESCNAVFAPTPPVGGMV
jgi:hypothetical protein